MKPTDDDILAHVKDCLDDANGFYGNHLQGRYVDRENIIDATADYYNAKFPNLAKIPLTSSDVSDTIGWILPALIEIFSATDNVVTVVSSNGQDSDRAQNIQDLLNYQTERLNDGFMNRYFWIKSCLEYNIGFKKRTWLREVKTVNQTQVMSQQEIQQLTQNPRVKVTKQTQIANGDYDLQLEPLFQVDYTIDQVLKNQPLDEIVPVTELRWNSTAHNLKEATFVAHKKKVNIDYLTQKQKAGIYQNIDQVVEMAGRPEVDLLEQQMRDYTDMQNYNVDDLTREVDIYECYVKYDKDGKGQLADWIFTVAGNANVLIGKQQNTLGRFHPFVDLVGMPDPWNVVPRKGLIEMLAEIQHINTALTRLLVRHLAVSSQGRRFVNKNVVDQDDILAEAMDVAVDGDPRGAVFPMPITNVSPVMMPFFQFLDTKLRKSAGVSEYNTGTDSQALNPTATGVTALIDQANKKIRLMARVMANYFAEDYRYLIRLNQEFMDEPQEFRLLNKTIQVTPDDLDGEFSLIVNTGVGSSSNQAANIQSTQLILSTLEKAAMAIPGLLTPDKVYNLLKMLLEQAGHKNVDDFINSPEIMQQIQAMQAQNPGSNVKGTEIITTAPITIPIPGQMQALAKIGINVTAQDYITDAQIKGAQGGIINGITGGQNQTAGAPGPDVGPGPGGPALSNGAPSPTPTGGPPGAGAGQPG